MFTCSRTYPSKFPVFSQRWKNPGNTGRNSCFSRSKELLEIAEKRNGLRYFAYFINKYSESGWNICKGDSELESFQMWDKSKKKMPPLWPRIRIIIYTEDCHISGEPYKCWCKAHAWTKGACFIAGRYYLTCL